MRKMSCFRMGLQGVSMANRLWNVYLSGEIHSPWRQDIITACEVKSIPVRFMGPELDHEVSDQCGEKILGPEKSSFWKDHKAAKINTIRNKSVLENSDIVIVRFGEKFRQWNAAFDAGWAVRHGCSVISFHDESLDHPLKEIDAVALAVARTHEQVVEILRYVTARPF